LALAGEERERILKIINDGIATRPDLEDYLQREKSIRTTAKSMSL
jgi:hypothetical protein